jgi:hypothetical protein
MALSAASRGLLLFVLALPAYPQITLTGAIQFSTNATGAAYGGLLWNTLGGDSYYDLWMSLGPDAASAVNGPSDAQAGISIALKAFNGYVYYIYGQPGPGIVTGFNGLNLFFDGNNSTPGISAFGATNSSDYLRNGSTTFTLQGTAAAGSGTNFYSADGVTVVLTGYNWNAPATPPGDVCQAFLFAAGDGPDYYGSVTLEAYPAATLTSNLSSAAPGTKIALTGSGFASMEKVAIYLRGFGFGPFAITAADGSGAFAVTARLPQAPHGPEDIYALGQSDELGAASIYVTPGLAVSPRIGAPGGAADAQGVGFGAGESVEIYWANPRQLLGTATTSSAGSFTDSGALMFTIPANAPPGDNAVTAIGLTTGAIGIGRITIE